MHPTVFVDQHPEALELTVGQGNLDSSQFHVVMDGFQLITGIQIRMAVIGASHFVVFDAGSFVWHEVFACTQVAGEPSLPLNELITAPVERQLTGYRYEFVTRCVNWQDAEPPELTNLINGAMRPQGIGLHVEFPAGDLPAVPKTVVVGYASEDQQGAVIETAHSYPNVKWVVFSRSTLMRT